MYLICGLPFYRQPIILYRRTRIFILLFFYTFCYVSVQNQFRLDSDLMIISTSLLSSSCMICKYVFCVVVILACPSLLATLAIETPANKRSDACVCRYGIITTNGKSLYFQGVHAFAVIYSIPFPS